MVSRRRTGVDEVATHSMPVITSRLRKSTRPCIIVLRVSGVRLMPPPAPPFVDVADDEAAGAEESSNAVKVEGSDFVRVGYR